MDKWKVAIIGGGQVAETTHIPIYQNREDIDLIAVMGHRKASAQAFARRHNISGIYTDVTEMLSKEQPDIVSVCTPNKYHFQYVKKALEAGCHVLCEKPPSISSAEAKMMAEIAKKHNRILAYNFQHRFSKEVSIVRQNYNGGTLGEVYHTKVSALRRSGVPGWGNFTNKDIQGGGPLIDIGIHMLDSALYILGFPKVAKVTAKMYRKIGPYKSEGTFGKWDPQKYEVEDSLFGFIELENGGLIQVETSFALHIKPEKVLNIEFSGSKSGASLYPLEIYTDEKGKLISLYDREVTNERDTATKSIETFIDHCQGYHSPLIANGEQGYFIQTLIEALYQAAETGESVYL
ncbi:Gfo/Idh/MocA family protein [Gracilibacillus sp. HCP3S3_G5_1]|uniref:Gfo/Idh/MocA family protein n=1 Tax=unclassified Gracilibacillus TaxID=2625209 RepID=UPI003F8CDDEA